MVALQSLIPEIPNRLPRWARLYLLFNSDFVDFLLETKVGRHRRPNFVIFVVSGAYIIDWWVVVVSSRNFYLEPAEIASIVLLVLFKDGGLRVSPRFHLIVSNVNQGNEEAG